MYHTKKHYISGKSIINQVELAENMSEWETEQALRRIDLKLKNLHRFRVRIMNATNNSHHETDNISIKERQSVNIHRTAKPSFTKSYSPIEWHESCYEHKMDALTYSEMAGVNIHHMKYQIKKLQYLEEMINRETILLKKLYDRFYVRKSPLEYSMKEKIGKLISYSILDPDGTVSKRYNEQVKEIEKALS